MTEPRGESEVDSLSPPGETAGKKKGYEKCYEN